MEKIDDLKSDRKCLKAGITRCFNFCNTPNLKTVCIASLIERRNKLTQVFSAYEAVNFKIERLGGDESEDVDAYEEKYFYSIASLNALIDAENAGTKEQGEFSHRLPPINLPNFDGKTKEYFPFINLYKSVVHGDKKLSNAEKLYYLKSLLRGEALDLINNLPLVGENYEVALNLLQERYENYPKIINQHINAILEMPTFNKCTSDNLRSIINTVKLNLSALQNLKQPVEYWDIIIINIVSKKVDSYTHRGFHLERDAKKVPILSEFLTFLEKRALAIESAGEEKEKTFPATSKPFRASSAATRMIALCKYCKQADHKLYSCPQYKLASVKDRLNFVNKNNLCKLCLNYHLGTCTLKFKCASCHKRHNTLLHLDSLLCAVNSATVSDESSVSNDTGKNNNVSLSGTSPIVDVLLPTACVRLIGKNGIFVYAKALLDSGSQVSFITQNLVNKLGCSTYRDKQTITGVCDGTSSVSKKAGLKVYSSISDYNVDVNCCVVDNITCPLPQTTIDISGFKIPSHIKLADSKFGETGEIALLIGCNVFFQVLQRECLPLSPTGPFLVNTLFGYVVAGNLPVSAGSVAVLSSNVCVTAKGTNFKDFFGPINNDINLIKVQEIKSLNETMSHFWENEKVPDLYTEASSEQQIAEQIFTNSVKLENNRFTVALPLKQEFDKIDLGDSLSCALQRLYNLERRFARDKDLYVKYKDFIDKYLAEGHGKYVDMSCYDLKGGNVYFLPHHPVFNPNSKTTPVRAVFDASMNTKNKICLNDLLLKGPTVQKELFDILISLRTYRYILLCDVKNMYRQVFIENKYCCLQNILWRESPHDPVRCIQLQTVTYGLKSSSYLATRCLVELAERYGDKYPLASFALLNASYVDDVQHGSNELCELIQTRNELIELLGKASFVLHKWCSNHPDVLADIPAESQSLSDKTFDKDSYVKTLGLTYNLSADTFNIACPVNEVQVSYTKRQVLSYISKFFDPLGLIGPIFVQAKSLMQQIWFESLNWDDVLPYNLNKKWINFAESLAKMSCISIPRNIDTKDAQSIELVGYADASNIAYGCCLYLRVVYITNIVNVMLLCSKSRINPKNKTLTTPRLELNSALLLALLAKKVYSTLSLKYDIKTFLYSDSQIVLSWLLLEPAKLGVYVANRVHKIQQVSIDCQWNYVQTNDNPADCLSRGVAPCSLQSNMLWWHGPSYLKNIDYDHCKNTFNFKKLSESSLPEVKVSKLCAKTAVAIEDSLFTNLLDKYSDINKTNRIMAYILRFFHNGKVQNVNCKNLGSLTPKELRSAMHVILRLDQQRHFANEIHSLQTQQLFKSNINNLNPFLDAQGMLRVGGRLQNSDLPFSKKHPIILAKNSSITKLIIQNEHLRLLHAGQKLVLSSLNDTYWIVNASSVIKSILYKCVKCYKLKAKNATQLMGSLPIDRVKMTRPFQIVGTDYGGPFYVKQSRVRKPVITKAYVVLFVCFVTKALHIELASDLTTNAFLGCLKRLIARRNKPSKIYCDNAACYKGAANKMKELYNLFDSTEHQNTVSSFSNSEGISFHFIPSYSPVFGGLWEAGIKSVKYHMKRVIGTTVLTYEEMYTVVVQIESILNSRPLTPMSRDPEDMSYLTPGHFLTGAPLSTFPEIDLSSDKVGKLSFWKQCVQMQQCFWKQWHKQYLVMLQSRPKWKGESANIKVGTMVVLKEDNVSPLHWPIGRVVNVMPGRDGKVRALIVKTGKGSIITTTIMKVCVLPIEW